jgi:hypothetical protein
MQDGSHHAGTGKHTPESADRTQAPRLCSEVIEDADIICPIIRCGDEWLICCTRLFLSPYIILPYKY